MSSPPGRGSLVSSAQAVREKAMLSKRKVFSVPEKSNTVFIILFLLIVYMGAHGAFIYETVKGSFTQPLIVKKGKDLKIKGNPCQQYPPCKGYGHGFPMITKANQSSRRSI